MRYKTTMVLLYACFVAVLALAIGLTYYNYSTDRFYEREKQSLDFYAREILQQFDNSVQMMGFGIDALISDIEVVYALREWSNAGRTSGHAANYIDEASSTLRSRLFRDTLIRFYRVIIFNKYGNVIANRTNARRSIDPSVTWKDIPWLDQLQDSKGKNVLIGPHRDDWGLAPRPMVYSYVKQVQGLDMGYIEVQLEVAGLQEILRSPNERIELALIYPDDTVMYSSGDIDEAECLSIAALAERGDYLGDRIVAIHRSNFTDALIMMMVTPQTIADETRYTLTATLTLCIAFSLVSLLFVYLISSYLTKPIEQVNRMIKYTRIETISEPVKRIKSIKEIEALVDVYQDLMERLSTSIETERQIARLNVQTQFDALQAQVNPHFLFNVLNVISQRGMINDDALICEICANLAAILRYSTNTRNRLATVEEELEYLSQYAFLLKSRYQHKFECVSECDDAVKELQIPRLTIQQLVENSINHGYANSAEPMRIRVCAFEKEGMYYIRVEDGGEGFPNGMIEAQHKRFSEIRNGFASHRTAPELEIGGMGLANIYARLYLVFGERMSIAFDQDETETAVVIRIGKEG